VAEVEPRANGNTMKLMQKVIIILAIIAFGVGAFSVHAQTYPEYAGYVNDFADVLTPSEEASLEASVKAFEQKTTNEIAVVTIKNLDGDTVDNYAVKLYEKWKIGKKGKDNGILILASIEDRSLRIEVGYGAEPLLTDGQAGEIIRNDITPEFKNGKYFKGLEAGVLAIESRLDGTAPKDESTNKASSTLPLIMILLIFLFSTGLIIGLIFLIFYAIKHGSKGGKSGWNKDDDSDSGSGWGSSSSSGGSSFGGGSSGGGGASGSW